MFDSTGLFHLNVFGRPALVRWPTDAEWCERSRRTRIVRTTLSGGRTKTDMPDAERVAAELFEKIRSGEKSESFDEAEGQFVIDRLEWCEVEDSEKTGDRYTVSLRVFGPQGDPSERPLTVHTISRLTLKEVKSCGKASVDRVDTRKESITRVALEPTGDLYVKHLISATGYAEGVPVPIIHKDAVITEVIRLLDETGIDYDPER